MEEEQKLLAAPEVQPVQPTDSKSRKAFWAVFVILALFVGGGVYAWQNSVSKSSLGILVNDLQFPESPSIQFPGGDIKGSFEDNPDPILSTNLLSVETQSKEVTTTSTQEMDSIEVVKDVKTLVLLAPNGGERYCLGEQLDIRWEQTGVEDISFFLHEDENAMMKIGVFSAGLDKDALANDVLFIQEPEVTSLSNIPAGSLYRVTIVDVSNALNSDTSNGVFSIETCE